LHGVDWLPASPGLEGDAYRSAWAKLWRREPEGEWSVVPFAPLDADHSQDGVRYDFGLLEGAYLLQVGGAHVSWRHVAVPGLERVTVTIVPDRERQGELRVATLTGNDDAESLLGYLRAGSIDHGELVLEKAEHLLYGKFKDPTAAAIAGYYLLRMRRFERLRDWAPNLANHFAWLPDGAVIDAWQHIHTGREHGGDDHFAEARARLLLAVARGLPLYTEGLRLLVDGLSLFATDDREVRAALKTVSGYSDAVDWTAATVTFAGIDPTRPDPGARYGMPASIAGMVMLERVDLSDLLRTGLLEADTTVRLDREPRVTGTVTRQATVRLRSGRSFADPDEAAKAAASKHPPWLNWWDWQVAPEQSLRRLADQARMASPRALPADPIGRLGLSTRTANALRGAGLSRVRDVVRRYDQLGQIAGIGSRSIQEIGSSLAASELRPP
jgi:hypothetical protein